MSLLEALKEISINLIQYGLPIIAIILSILSFIDSKKANRLQGRLNQVEERLITYELEEKEKEREEATKACIEARIVKISKNNYRMKIWNSGKATAYNVDFSAEEVVEKNIFKDKVPYAFLEPNKSFEEHFLVHSGVPQKFSVTTVWKDENGNSHLKDQILSW